ncbi:cytochrome P450 [Mycena maculata]|uniref:Cytochrome P450 n=1 Tax=Mycena maculata TaxID=230809 RepID=A0AAD7I5W2_9AGAR|nr:cytochrome P450 [Mycena maculata]
MLSQILLPIAATLLSYGLFHVLQFVYRELTSPLRHVAGPRNPSFILGNFTKMSGDPTITDKWRREFGPNFRFNHLFSISHLHTADLKAVTHVLTNGVVYQRPTAGRDATRRLLGNGLLSLELDEHKRQANCVQNQAFGVAQVRLLTETFVEKAIELREIWAGQVAPGNTEARIDVLTWLRRMTLDVIGQAGFNYQFDALDTKGKPNELNQAFTDLFHSPTTERDAGFRFAQSLIPILRLLPVPGAKYTKNAREKMFTISSEIVSTSKANIKASTGEKSLSGRRDLLSVLLKSNLSPNIPESQRLSDAEVVDQIPAFFVAGHETTSSAVSWALHALSFNIAAQSKLREELLTVSTENPTMDELNALPYLESVVREILRVHAPVVFITRMAMEDDVLPLSKPYIDKTGKSHDSLPIPKGQIIHIPILAINTDPEIWGEDAAEFRPERWEHVPDAVSGIPGVWANLLTFLAGPHNCIGFRFSLVEIKVLLFVLIRAFEFHPAVPKGGIVRTGTVLQRPTALSEADKTSTLPLIVKPYDSQGY